MPVDAFNAATPLDSDQAMEAAAELRAIKLRLNNVAFFDNGAPVTTLHDAWQLDFTGTGVALSVAGNVLTIAGLGAIIPADLVASNSLQVGTGTTIKTAPYLGTAKYYHEASSNLDQSVQYKNFTGTLAATDLGRTWQDTKILTYNALLDPAINPVAVCAANQSFTAVVGNAALSRGSVVNQQNVIEVYNADNALGPCEYASTVYLLDPILGGANFGHTYWGNDWTVNGPRDGPPHALYGTVQSIQNWNTLPTVSTERSVGFVVTTRPRGGAAGSQMAARAGKFTFPLDRGIVVCGFSGLNDYTTVNGAYHAGATKGFEVGIQVGGKEGPWLQEPGVYPNGGSKIGTAVALLDYIDNGIYFAAPHPSATAHNAIAINTGAGHIYFISGAWNTDHLILGAIHLWQDGAGVLRFKNGVPASAVDGTPWPSGTPVTAVTASSTSGGLTLSSSGGTTPAISLSGTPTLASNASALNSKADTAFVQGLAPSTGSVSYSSGGGMSILCTVSGVTTYGNGVSSITIESVSDRRLKKNIKNEKLGLAFVEKLRPVTYKWKNNKNTHLNDTITYHGLIHDEVAALGVPEGDSLNIIRPDGYNGTDYMSLIAVYAKAFQEVSSRLKNLETKVFGKHHG